MLNPYKDQFIINKYKKNTDNNYNHYPCDVTAFIINTCLYLEHILGKYLKNYKKDTKYKHYKY